MTASSAPLAGAPRIATGDRLARAGLRGLQAGPALILALLCVAMTAWMRDHLPKGGAKLGVILCVAGHPVTTARLDGFMAGLGDAKVKVVAKADAQCDPEKGRKAMENMLSAHPELDAVFSTSDSQSLGAIKALKAAGKDPVFVSFDAQAPVVKAMRSGEVIDASVAWSAKEIGADAVRAAVAASRKQPVEKKTLVPVTVVDADNAAAWAG